MIDTWRMDPDIFGMPDYGMGAGQSRTFTPYLGDKGSGRYGAYNPTAPIPMQIAYGWTGDVYAQFRSAWEDTEQLAFGSRWIRITLPVDFVVGRRGIREYDAHVIGEFNASLIGVNYWKVSMSIDVDASPTGEAVAPPPVVPNAPTADMWTLQYVPPVEPDTPTAAMWTLELAP